MASSMNQHCANCINTLSFPVRFPAKQVLIGRWRRVKDPHDICSCQYDYLARRCSDANTCKINAPTVYYLLFCATSKWTVFYKHTV